MKKFTIVDPEGWKNAIMSEARYYIPEECRGGICVDAGCNVGDFELNHRDRFDRYICFDVLDQNISECIKNTAGIRTTIEVHKLAVWSEDDLIISVMAYEKHDTKDLQFFGNSGNIGTVEYSGAYGEGWRPENTIDTVKTISLKSIIEKYGTINLLKIDTEGAEYKFLLGQDLSKINFIVGEFHFGEERIKELEAWIGKTHTKYPEGYFKLNSI